MISVRLDDVLERKLIRFVKQHKTTKSDTIKKALIYYFKFADKSRQPTGYQLGEDLFGRYGSGRADLSSTYKTRLKKKINAKNHH